MAVIRKLTEVFSTVGLPPYTYVKPSYFGEVRTDIDQPGKHVLIEGPSGIGKTCVVFKVFEELKWLKDVDYTYIGGRDEGAESTIEALLAKAKRGERLSPEIIVIDDYHILDETFRKTVGADLKRISDSIFQQSTSPKFILVGIPASGASLLSNAQDLGPRLGSYRFRAAPDGDILKLINEGEEQLNIIFDDADIILSESSGNFWLAQHICSKICSINEIYSTGSGVVIVMSDLLEIRRKIMDELTGRFLPTAVTFAKGKKWRPGGNKPYLEIFLALAKTPDLVVPFDTILSIVAERRRPGIKAVRNRIKEVLFDPTRSIDLRKQIAFEDTSFSVEDPLFRYFLNNLDVSALHKELGIEPIALSKDVVFSYDVGFSFSGETRSIVEEANTQLKREDVVTFYDFDQQAFLLAQNLETTLTRIYTESCKYYLVFIDNNYRDKVWTNFERDILTASKRSKHIIPVFLVKPETSRLVGIPSVTGMIDLSDLWRQMNDGTINMSDVSVTIRNRVVLPLLEKLDSNFPEV